MKKVFYIAFPILIFILCLSSVSAANLTDAFKSSNSACTTGSALECASNSGGYLTGSSAKTPEDFISLGITTILSLLGVIFLILIVYAGIKWMLAGGNEQQVEGAQNILKRAIIGLIIVLAAYAISYFILNVLISDNRLGPTASSSSI